MTEQNPFEKPVEHNPYTATPVARGPEPMPTGVMVFSIIALILGVLGLFGSCFGAAAMFASDSLMSFLPNEEAKNATKQAMAIQFVPGIVQSILGFVLSAALLVAGIGCLTRKEWGRNLMRLSMFGCILNSLLGICVNIWLMVAHADTMAGVNVAQGMGKEQALQFFYAGQIFGLLVVGVFLLAYIFGAVYFGRQSVVEFFERQAQAAR